VAQLAKPLLTAATSTGVGTSVDLTVMARSLTMQVLPGGVTPDLACQVQLQGSLDGVNFFGMGQITGAAWLSVDEDVVQYVRANVLKLASGNITANIAYVSG
jgi:hypothetical protein